MGREYTWDPVHTIHLTPIHDPYLPLPVTFLQYFFQISLPVTLSLLFSQSSKNWLHQSLYYFPFSWIHPPLTNPFSSDLTPLILSICNPIWPLRFISKSPFQWPQPYLYVTSIFLTSHVSYKYQQISTTMWRRQSLPVFPNICFYSIFFEINFWVTYLT